MKLKIEKRGSLTLDSFHKLREYYKLEFKSKCPNCIDNLVQYKDNGNEIII